MQKNIHKPHKCGDITHVFKCITFKILSPESWSRLSSRCTLNILSQIVAMAADRKTPGPTIQCSCESQSSKFLGKTNSTFINKTAHQRMNVLSLKPT